MTGWDFKIMSLYVILGAYNRKIHQNYDIVQHYFYKVVFNFLINLKRGYSFILI